MWLISLVLSLTSALMAILLQQWARSYVETLRAPIEPNNRARVRWFLFDGTEVYKMRLLVELVPTFIHHSVYMFLAGLVIVFHTINQTVAIAVDVSVGIFGLAYSVLSIIPCCYLKCPYRTPMSYIFWYSWHTFLYLEALCLSWFLEIIHESTIELGPDNKSGCWDHNLVSWLRSRKIASRKEWRHLIDGFSGSVIKDAKSAKDGDHKFSLDCSTSSR